MRLLQSTRLLGLASTLVVASGRPLAAEPIARLSLEPNPAMLAVGCETVAFDVWLRDYVPETGSDAIVSFGLNVADSDDLLTGGGGDFSRFNFILDAGLAGILGAFPGSDLDIGDDGRVEITADVPFESGILQSMGDVRLGTLSVVAPATPGDYSVAFHADASSPISQGGTFLLIDAAGLPALPGDGTLELDPSEVIVVPEPTCFVLTFSSSLGLFLRTHKRPFDRERRLACGNRLN